MRAAIYARYSSEGQREQSIEDQIADCNEYAARYNYQIVGVYADYAKTGRNDQREQFQLMLSDSDKQLFDTLLVWKLDRFGRNRAEMAINKLRLKKNGVNIISIKENIPDGPEGIILESVMEGLAEYYSANLAQNIKRGLNSNAKKGLCNGALPIGYDHVGDEIVVNKEQAYLIQTVYKKFLSGLSLADVVREINSMGFRTKKGNPFTRNTIEYMLRNERYTGKYIYSDVVIPDAYEAIISESDFLKAQDMLDHLGYKRKADCEIYWLRGILYCGECGEQYVGESGTSKLGRKYYYYKCKGRKRKKTDCKNDTLKKDEIEQAILQITIDKVLNDAIIDPLADKIAEILNNNDSTDLIMLKKQQRELNTKITNLLNALEQGAASARITERLNEYEQDLDLVSSKIKLEEIKNPHATVEEVKWALKNFKLSYLNDDADKIALITRFINRVDYNKGILTINYNFVYLDEQGNIRSACLCSTNTKMVERSSIVLNTIQYNDNGTFSYSFDYNEFLKAA